MMNTQKGKILELKFDYWFFYLIPSLNRCFFTKKKELSSDSEAKEMHKSRHLPLESLDVSISLWLRK